MCMEKVDRHKAAEAENISIPYWWCNKPAEKIEQGSIMKVKYMNMHLQAKVWEWVGKGPGFVFVQLQKGRVPQL